MKSLVFTPRSWWKYEYTVARDDMPAGTFEMQGWTMNGARAVFDGTEWQLSTDSWTRMKAKATDADGAVVALMEAKSWWRLDADVTVYGKKFSVHPVGWFGTRYTAKDDTGRDVLHLRLRYWNVAAEIEVLDYGTEPRIVYLLSSLIFFRAKLVEMDSAAASATGGAVVATS